MGVPDEFSEWHAYNERFLAHISTSPAHLNRSHIKPHLNYLLVGLDFLPQVNSYLDAHLATVSSEEQARRVFTLLDLFSAQEPLRHRHLKQVGGNINLIITIINSFSMCVHADLPSQRLTVMYFVIYAYLGQDTVLFGARTRSEAKEIRHTAYTYSYSYSDAQFLPTLRRT